MSSSRLLLFNVGVFFLLLWNVEANDLISDNNDLTSSPLYYVPPQSPYTGLVYANGHNQYVYPYQNNPFITAYAPGFTYANVQEETSPEKEEKVEKDVESKNDKKKKPNKLGNALAAGAGLALVGLAAHHLVNKPNRPSYPAAGYNNYYYHPSNTGYHSNIYNRPPPPIPPRPSFVNTYPSYPVNSYPSSNNYYPSTNGFATTNYRPTYVSSSKPFYGGIAREEEKNKDSAEDAKKPVGTRLQDPQTPFYTTNIPSFTTLDNGLIYYTYPYLSKQLEIKTEENDDDNEKLVGASYVGFYTPDKNKPGGIFGHPEFTKNPTNQPLLIKPIGF